MEDGKEYPVDILICAVSFLPFHIINMGATTNTDMHISMQTGFDTTFKPRFPLVGPHGRKLSDGWKDEPRSYLGVAAAGYPNYYMFLGPNSPIGNGPVLVGIEGMNLLPYPREERTN